MNKGYDDFNLNEIVWDVVYGKGTVTAKEPYECTFPIEVTFDETGEELWYTKDGRWNENRPRTLFFSEPKIEASVKRPFTPTLIGKTVVIQWYDGTWKPEPFKITSETEHQIYEESQNYYKDDILAIAEVLPENLLKS